MNIKINSYNNYNFAFCAKRPKLSNDELTRLLTPFKDSRLSVEDIMKQTGFPKRTITDWFNRNFGMSAAKVYKSMELNELREEFTALKREGKSYGEIAELKGKTKKWVDKKMGALKITRSREEINKLLDENIPWMLVAGYTVEKISKALQIGTTTIYKKMKKYNPIGMVQFRKNNDITIWRDLDLKHENLKKEMTEFFANGGTVNEAKKRFNMNGVVLYHWMEVFNIKSLKQKTSENMKEHLLDRVKAGVPVPEIAREFGVADTTIYRNIKKMTGKTHTELMAEINSLK